MGNNATVQKIQDWVPRPGQEEKHIYIDYDQVLVKTDPDGNALWAKSYHVEGYKRLEPGQLIHADDGAYVIASMAVADNEPGMTENPLTNKVCLLKIDSDGQLLWSKLLQAYNTSKIDYSSPSISSLIETSDKGFALTTTMNFGMYLFDNLMVKVDASGNLEWNKSIVTTDSQTHFSKMLEASDGSFLIVGYIYGHPNFHGPATVCKVDSVENFQWQKRFGGEGEYYYAQFSYIEKADERYMIIGSASPEKGPGHLWFVKIDPLANITENHFASGQYGGYITRTIDGGFAFAGSITTYVVQVGKMDNVDNLTAEVRITIEDPYGNISPSSIIQAEDGGYVFTGTWDITSDAGNSKMWLVKIDSTIYPSPSVPELPTWIILPLAAVSSLLAVLASKKKRKILKNC